MVKWTDRDHNFEAEFVMEVPCSNAPPSCANVSEDKPGFTFLGEYNDAKYYASNSAADWGYAKSDCEAKGGHLVVINDEAENDFVKSAINPASGSIWTGLNTVYSPNVFNWINNDPVNYTNWQAGEPNGNGIDQAALNEEIFWRVDRQRSLFLFLRICNGNPVRQPLRHHHLPMTLLLNKLVGHPMEETSE